MSNPLAERWLLIDDIRTMYVDHIARTAQEGKDALQQGPWGHLVLDNDLGEGQEEGWQILEWALANNCLPPHVQLVTSNPAARARMQLALRNAGYVGTTIDFRKGE